MLTAYRVAISNEDLPPLLSNNHTFHRMYVYQHDQHEYATASLT